MNSLVPQERDSFGVGDALVTIVEALISPHYPRRTKNIKGVGDVSHGDIEVDHVSNSLCSLNRLSWTRILLPPHPQTVCLVLWVVMFPWWLQIP
jgi:hypothetical protein